MKKAVLAVAAVAVLVAVGLGAWLALGGDDETSVRDTCGGNAYELAVEDEDGQVEVTFELQAANAGETWQVLVEQGDRTLLDGSRTTDEDAELDVDVPANGDDGDEFTVTATPEGGEPCVARLTR
ncbi:MULTISPECIES: hypothetical protein [Nocardioides]|uniref:Uncharacterized protein n=1 Tax=Nocardioides lianchengensis TaxID=1045774 RepID=A0A1G6W6T6_9ACTN|nr:hypothetical protein [Nocardioides lianchengensis]NYG09416.1 hypothetical protein [Nocardioides lianchengensis]SDD61541.1 hypothetical protein SAMN05421872_109192 [Nocardioides lianchengensis]